MNTNIFTTFSGNFDSEFTLKDAETGLRSDANGAVENERWVKGFTSFIILNLIL